MKIHFSAKGLELNAELEKYANGKIVGLVKKVPRRLRAEAVVSIDFLQHRKKGKDFKTCSIMFTFNDTELKAAETTLHMYAALDIAAVHMERQLIDYATKRHGGSLTARLRRRLKKDWQ